MASAPVRLWPWPRWLLDFIQWNCRSELPEYEFNNGVRDCRVSRLNAHNTVSTLPQRLFGRDGSRRFGHDLRVIFTSLARGFWKKQIDALVFTIYNKSLCPVTTSKLRLVNTVSCHTLIMTISLNSMKDSLSFWLPILLRGYAVTSDRFFVLWRVA